MDKMFTSDRGFSTIILASDRLNQAIRVKGFYHTSKKKRGIRDLSECLMKRVEREKERNLNEKKIE